MKTFFLSLVPFFSKLKLIRVPVYFYISLFFFCFGHIEEGGGVLSEIILRVQSYSFDNPRPHQKIS